MKNKDFKTVLVVIDGIGDVPNPMLNNQTPLEAAFTPHLHYIATNGSIGCINTVFKGFPIESMVCIMGLIGYNPEQYYPAGRAAFEAMAKGIPLNPNDLVLRCNLISLDDKKEKLADFTAGLITDSNARKVISKIKLPFSNWELYPGQSYRNILIIREANINAKMIKCYEPHMNIGNDWKGILPSYLSNEENTLIKQIKNFLEDSVSQIAGMDLPEDCKADMLWVWSPSKKVSWPSFKSRFNLDAAFVGALDFLHGIAMAADIHFDIIPGATGYIDTNYEEKGKYALKYLEEKDLILVHINATDEEAHQLNHMGKIEAIEKIDKLILGPILNTMEKKYKGNFRLVVCGDHETRSTDGKHGSTPVPYAIYGKEIETNPAHLPMTEKNCSLSEPINSLDFLQSVTTI